MLLLPSRSNLGDALTPTLSQRERGKEWRRVIGAQLLIGYSTM